jgi:pyruvate,orthophosphate dikinase
VAPSDARAEPWAKGLAASPGIASGEVVTTPDEAVRLGEEGRPVILVRSETSPDDVHGMAKAAGIVTARGGIASHAAVVARGWGIPAVVGVEDLVVRDDGIAVDGVELRSGETLTIDGSTGAVYRGRFEAATQPVPAVRTLLEWAKELGIPIAGPSDEVAAASAGDGGRGSVGTDADTGSHAAAEITPDLAIQLLGVKGFATSDTAAEALDADPATAKAVFERLVAERIAVVSAGTYRLTDQGRDRYAELVAMEREAIPSETRAMLLPGFAALDGRMKEIVTAWQMRDPGAGGAPVMNDHGDPDYDRIVLDRLEALASDADAWLGGLAAWPRSDGYRARLARALERTLGGDPRYVASPRVDSYHGVWFELHEELIQLAGTSRAEEVAAGRA